MAESLYPADTVKMMQDFSRGMFLDYIYTMLKPSILCKSSFTDEQAKDVVNRLEERLKAQPDGGSELMAKFLQGVEENG